MLSLACVAMGLHANYIRKTFDGCPVSVFVGKSGRGKTYSLKTHLALLGKLVMFLCYRHKLKCTTPINRGLREVFCYTTTKTKLWNWPNGSLKLV